MTAERRKLEAEMTEQKYVVGEMKKISLEDLSSSITFAHGKINEF